MIREGEKRERESQDGKETGHLPSRNMSTGGGEERKKEQTKENHGKKILVFLITEAVLCHIEGFLEYKLSTKSKKKLCLIDYFCCDNNT